MTYPLNQVCEHLEKDVLPNLTDDEAVRCLKAQMERLKIMYESMVRREKDGTL